MGKGLHDPASFLYSWLQRDARLTLRVISGLDDAWSVTGYAMPAEFQKIGLAGERSNWKFDTRVARTTSESRDRLVRHAQHTGTL